MRGAGRVPGLGAVPLDEVGDRVVVTMLATFLRKAIQDSGFGLFEVGKC
jgi:hypothetical protein